MGHVRAPQAPAGLRPAELDLNISSINLHPNSSIDYIKYSIKNDILWLKYYKKFASVIIYLSLSSTLHTFYSMESINDKHS